MNDSVLELVQGIFNTFLFAMSVMFIVLLIGIVTHRSASMDAAGDNRIVYKKEAVEDSVYTIKGSSIIDTICKMISASEDVKVNINGVTLSEAVLHALYMEEMEAISDFYRMIDADKEYTVYFEYGDIKLLEIVEAD